MNQSVEPTGFACGSRSTFGLRACIPSYQPKPADDSTYSHGSRYQWCVLHYMQEGATAGLLRPTVRRSKTFREGIVDATVQG